MPKKKLDPSEMLHEIKVFIDFMDSRGCSSVIVDAIRREYQGCLKVASPSKSLLTFTIKEKNTFVREVFSNAERAAFSDYQKSLGMKSDDDRFREELIVIFERGQIQTDDEFESVKQFVEIIYAQKGETPLLETSNQLLAQYEARKKI